jgi:hypothetical protein
VRRAARSISARSCRSRWGHERSPRSSGDGPDRWPGRRLSGTLTACSATTTCPAASGSAVKGRAAHSVRGRLRLRYPPDWLRPRQAVIEGELARVPGVLRGHRERGHGQRRRPIRPDPHRRAGPGRHAVRDARGIPPPPRRPRTEGTRSRLSPRPPCSRSWPPAACSSRPSCRSPAPSWRRSPSAQGGPSSSARGGPWRGTVASTSRCSTRRRSSCAPSAATTGRPPCSCGSCRPASTSWTAPSSGSAGPSATSWPPRPIRSGARPTGDARRSPSARSGRATRSCWPRESGSRWTAPSSTARR